MPENDRVTLSVPARGEFARTVRLLAAELATHVGMSIDEVDDVRLAVEEAFVYATRGTGVDSVGCTFTLDEKSLELLVGPMPDGFYEKSAEDPSARYARFILEGVCDEFEMMDRDDGSYIRLVRRMD